MNKNWFLFPAVVLALFVASSTLSAQQVTCQAATANPDTVGLLDLSLSPCIVTFGANPPSANVALGPFEYTDYATQNEITLHELNAYLFTGSLAQVEAQISLVAPSAVPFSDGSSLKRFVISFGRVSQSLDTTRREKFEVPALTLPKGTQVIVWYVPSIVTPSQNCSLNCGWSGEIVLQ